MRIASLLLTTATGLAGTVLSSVLPDMRITNGTLSPQGRSPYFIQLLTYEGNDTYGRCGGTILDATTVITAAHCVTNMQTKVAYDASALTVIYGSVVQLEGTRVNATSLTVHPNFNNNGHLHNDIAIIQVPPMDLQPGKAEAITVYNGDIEPLDQMKIFGWGLTVTGGTGANLSTALLTQKVYVGEAQDCQTIDPSYEDANGWQICANNDYHTGVDACQGDSGTGTIITVGGHDYYAGFVSYGTDAKGNRTCGQAGSFGFYTRPYYYIPWIESVIKHGVSAGPQLVSTPAPVATPTQTPAPQPTSSSSSWFSFVSTGLSVVLPDMRFTNDTASPQVHRGATILGATTVVSAAHCVYDADNDTVYLTASITVIYGNVAPGTGFRVVANKVTMNPQLNETGNFHNDILIIQMPAILLKQGYTEALPVYNSDIQPHQKMDILGWGLTVAGGTGSNLSIMLLTQKVYVGEPQDCQVIDPIYDNTEESLICVDNNYNAGVDVCQSDSGTGTIVTTGGKSHIAGLTSYGRNKEYNVTCGQLNSFGIYMRISHFVPWIESITGQSIATGPVSTASTTAHVVTVLLFGIYF
ncbi:hypothetical protein EV179_005959 [Coemansia sp. RSA 487]|nr:hypothetical protein LPJ74_004784 [Coemansia sp. RSA 1843]KAJ2210840.1 hypothetical protein EV179_005959 [Coemansia sp. RSA 487]